MSCPWELKSLSRRELHSNLGLCVRSLKLLARLVRVRRAAHARKRARARAKRAVLVHERRPFHVRRVLALDVHEPGPVVTRVAIMFVSVEPMERLLERLDLRVALKARPVVLECEACFAERGIRHGLAILPDTLVQAA